MKCQLVFGSMCGSKTVAWDDCEDSPFKITVHDREEHLEEEVDGVDQHRQQVKPCFARHHCDFDVASSIIDRI